MVCEGVAIRELHLSSVLVTDITLWGLEIGLLSMTKGEAALFILTPEYAYGPRGCPPSIPPNTTVLFKVEVLDFIDSEECDAFFELTYVSSLNKA